MGFPGDQVKELAGLELLRLSQGGEIDTPAVNACVAPELVPACLTGGTPLAGIRITGTAAGAPFHHYTLRYRWGGNPPVNDAVVYPDCSRPPAVTVPTNPGGAPGTVVVPDHNSPWGTSGKAKVAAPPPSAVAVA